MTPRLLTRAEATEFIETAFGTAPDEIGASFVETTVCDMDVPRATADTESYLAIIASEIDPASIRITTDAIEGSDLDCVNIYIRTGDGA